ncbi:MAG: UDP-N-acetylmuramoyl-tripeptide--D-alanyl-D-alanine ligase [Patescibacteria group bacterium]
MIKNILKYIIVAILTLLARLALKKYKPKIIAVGGSVGKTSTKDAIYTVLSSSLLVWKSEKSYNSEIGVPLAVLGLENAWENPLKWLFNIVRAFQLIIFKKKYPRYLVLEVGADRPGDIARIVSWLKPDISVIGSFGFVPVHIEFFKNRDELIKEDGKIAEALKERGLLIVSQDDDDSLSFKTKTKARVVSYGFKEGATITASNSQIMYDDAGLPLGMTYKIEHEGNIIPVRIEGVLGNASVYATLPALLVGRECGVNIVEGIEALYKHKSPPGRLRIIKGEKDTIIIDDTYNSSPIAAEEALKVLKELRVSGKKMAVLGDMLELGRNSEEEHKKLGVLGASACDILVTVGIRARGIAEGALGGGLPEKNIFQFEDAVRAGKFIERVIEKGDAILIKGSQSMRMERIVEEIMAEPEKKEKLLVRQEGEWKKR